MADVTKKEVVTWRESKWFVYGWLPFRLLASGVAFVGLGVVCVGVYLMWFSPRDVREIINEVM